MPRALVVIPARFSSSRFPGKPLVTLQGKTLLAWVWEGARGSTLATGVVVATDDPRIADEVRRLGGEVEMTPSTCASGTDRVALVAAQRPDDVVVNLQGDEPLVTGDSLDRLIAAFEDPSVEAATLREPFETVGDLFDPNQVKVVTSPSGDALYFSRSPIPYFRAKGPLTADFRAAMFQRPEHLTGYWKHVGIYAYRREVLAAFTRSAPTPLETLEGLEQLRLLETGRRIRVLDADFRSVGVDTPQDLRRASLVLEERERIR